MSDQPARPDVLVPPGERPVDVVCLGTALVDHLAFAGEEEVAALGLQKGAMSLVDLTTSERIRAGLGEQRQISGGTVANTAVGIAALGGHPVFVGAVGEDELGDRFAADLAGAGVEAVLQRHPAPDGRPVTGRSVVIVTPDAERTMATTLGVAPFLDREAVGPGLIEAARLVYFDGYVLDFPDAERLVERLVELAAEAGTPLALGLADPLVVRRHRRALTALTEDGVALVFANESEATALVGTADVGRAVAALRRPGLAVVVTRGAKGAVLATERAAVEVPAEEVERVVDATGAGDLFAAGVCFGITHGLDLVAAGRLGALAAGEAVSHLGARPVAPLRELAAGRGLLGPGLSPAPRHPPPAGRAAPGRPA